MLTTRREAAAALVAAAFCRGHAQTASVTEKNEFQQWAIALPPDSFPDTGAALFEAYRAKLIREGLSASEADEVIKRLRAPTSSNKDLETLFYNKMYEKAKSPFSVAPNKFLVEVVGTLSPGKALDLGMGEGRNAIFLAQRGWEVTGIDLAEVGVVQARKRAQSMGLKVNAIIQDANLFDYGSQQWELVCMMYFDGSGFVHDFEKRVAAGLKTGGYLIAERPLGSQPNPKMLLDRWTLWEPFGFRLIRLEYRSEDADWGHSGLGRYLIQKL
jgi:SAM-dependent methyltransferase